MSLGRRWREGLWAVGLAACSAPATTAPPPLFPDVVRRSQIVFTATVVEEGTRPALVGDRFLEGRMLLRLGVETVLRVPGGVRLRSGDTVWVEPLVQDLQTGERGTWFTSGWIFGPELLLRENGHERELRSVESIEQAVAMQAEDDLRARLDRAVAVVRGTVSAVAPVVPPGDGPRRPRSEHDPRWHLATVAVSEWLKGEPGVPDVRVRFAGSDDVAWYRSAKLAVGQPCILMLGEVGPDGNHEVVDPGDVQSEKDRARIIDLLRR